MTKTPEGSVPGSEKLDDPKILDTKSSPEVPLTPEEQVVEDARNKYIEEYTKHRNEARKAMNIEKVRITAFNILTSAHNVFSKEKIEKKSVDEEKYFPESYKESKKAYDEARVALGNSMFATKKAEFEKSGVSGEKLEKDLQAYKGKDILEKIIIDERQKVIDAKADRETNERKHWQKAVDWYLKQPRWKKVALSTALFLPAAATGALGASVVAGYGIAGLATVNFAKSMATGTVVAHLSKGVDWLKRKSDAEFKTTQAEKESVLQEKFAKGEIDIESFEKEENIVRKENQKHARKRALTKMAVGIALGAGAGLATNIALGSAVEHTTIPHPIPDHTPAPIHEPTVDTGLIQKGEGVTHPLSRQIEQMIHDPENAKRLGYTGGDMHKFAIAKSAELAKEYGYIRADGSEIRLNEQAIGHTSYNVSLNENGKLEVHESFNGKDVGTKTVDAYEYETKPKPHEAVIKTEPLTQTTTPGTQNLETVPTESQFGNAFHENEQVSGLPRIEYYREITHHLEMKGTHWASQADYDAELWKWEKFGKIERIDDGTGNIKLRFYDPQNNVYLQKEINTPANNLMLADKNTPEYNVVGKELVELRERVLQTTGQAIDPNNGEAMDSYVRRLMHTLEGDTQGHTRPFGGYPIQETSLNQTQTGIQGNGNVVETGGQQKIIHQTNDQQAIARQSNNQIKHDTGSQKYEIETEGKFKPIHPERYRDHIDGIEDIHRRDVIVGKSPQTTTHDGISYTDWNKATDKMFDHKDFPKEHKFPSYNAYERDRELQNLFGYGEKTDGKVVMDYFRERSEWNIIQKMPASYFFNINKHISEIPPEDLNRLMEAGIVTDNYFTKGGITIHNYSFTNKDELVRLATAYSHVNPSEVGPYQNETIEQYVERMTKDIHQADDGTLFARKDVAKTDLQGKPVSHSGRGGSGGGRPQRAPLPQSQPFPYPVGGGAGGGVISPTNGVYNTGGVPTIAPTRGVYNTGFPQFNTGGNGPFYEPGVMGGMMQNGRNLGNDAVIGGVNVAGTAINEAVREAQGASDGQGGERILSVALQESVRIGVNGLLRGMGMSGGGGVWR